jgi:hypothetical protein
MMDEQRDVRCCKFDGGKAEERGMDRDVSPVAHERPTWRAPGQATVRSPICRWR